MSNFSDSFWRRAGKNTADRVSNAIFGDNWARPYKRITDEARADAIRQKYEAKAEAHRQRAIAERERAEAIATAQEAQAAIDKKNQLNAIDAAVIENVDKVISMPLSSEPNELVQLLSGLVIQLQTNTWDKKTEEGRIRSKYTEAVFQKFKQGLDLLISNDPNNPQVNYLIDNFCEADKKRNKSNIFLRAIGYYMFVSFFIAIAFTLWLSEMGFLALLTLIAMIAILIYINRKTLIHWKIKLRKARKAHNLPDAITAQPTSATKDTTEPIKPTPSTFNQKHSYDHLWNKYSHLSPLMQNGYRTCQLTGHKDILIVGLYYPYMQIKQGNTIYPIGQYEWKQTLDFILKETQIDLTNRASYLDLFPIQSEPFKIMDDIIRNPKMFDYVIEQISLDQTIIEDIVRPKLIIVTDNDAAAFFGKLPEYIWMGYKFQLIEKTPRGELYRIVGFRPEERIQPNRALTNLIGTKVYFTVNDIPSGYETNLWLNN